MNKGIKKLNTILFSVILCLTFSVTAFAEKTVKYSNDLTVTPIRIFFAILVIVLFIIGEIAFGVNDNMLMVTVTVGLGAVLFALSDISLGLILSSDKPRVRSHRIFNIITYYAAQVLLAASIFFVYSRELY